MINNSFFYNSEITISRFEYVNPLTGEVYVIYEKWEQYFVCSAQYINNLQCNIPQPTLFPNYHNSFNTSYMGIKAAIPCGTASFAKAY